ncbi:NYN domain-containing protein [Microbacterium testaceum]|uniref:NYN domain-containing protein n=1 Tax=Microbacterium testaceum TaxID=2033 RepID=UPI00187CC760|nr:NYN domain-containing protein [Microbacterium testaceum]
MSTRRRAISSGRRFPASSLSERTLHLLDVENLVGGVVDPVRVRRMWEAYPVSVADGDLVIAAFGAERAAHGMFALPSRVRPLVGSRGRDAADRALLAEIDVAWVAARFDRVVIASGDHIFTGMALALREAGVSVMLVARSMHISASLYSACTDDRRIEMPAA